MKEIILTEEEIQDICERIAKDLEKKFKNNESAPIFICVLKGATPFFMDVVKHYTKPVKIDFMEVSSYSGTSSTGVIHLSKDITENIKGKDVVFIEDVVDTGLTINYLKQYIQIKYQPKSITTAALVDKKALRKVIRTLCHEFAKDELDNMIWEVDENFDGYISEKEFENMYKKCISDDKEEEGKKLFYLIQFLMYDKDEKHEITVEDTLEILCARNPNNVDACLDSIFDVEQKDEKGKVRKVKRETISFLEYTQRMHELSMKKRSEISNKKKIFCDKIQQDAIKEAKERAERKKMMEGQLLI